MLKHLANVINFDLIKVKVILILYVYDRIHCFHDVSELCGKGLISVRKDNDFPFHWAFFVTVVHDILITAQITHNRLTEFSTQCFLFSMAVIQTYSGDVCVVCMSESVCILLTINTKQTTNVLSQQYAAWWVTT